MYVKMQPNRHRLKNKFRVEFDKKNKNEVRTIVKKYTDILDPVDCSTRYPYCCSLECTSKNLVESRDRVWYIRKTNVNTATLFCPNCGYAIVWREPLPTDLKPNIQLEQTLKPRVVYA